ncbi:MAG: anti-sigma factor domain-containing protein [Clostridiales bacterium]|nr:anti-sigma factor domain-containing protein [Clostridiales bacterium]
MIFKDRFRGENVGGFDKNKFSFSKIDPIVDLSEKGRKIRENNVSLLLRELFLYKVLLKDLTAALPNNFDRNLLLNLAFYSIDNFEILDKFQKSRKLPINKICKETGVARVFLERWQDYLITYIIILANPNYKALQDYFIIEYNGDSILSDTYKNQDKELHKGIVLKSKKRSCTILTSKGEFLNIKIDNHKLVGETAEGKEKLGFKHIKLKLAIVAFLLILILIAGYRQYTKPVRTIVINSTSIIKIETNTYDNVIYIYSSSEKGKELINNLKAMDENIDNVIEGCIEYANENEMIPNDGIIITVTGEPIKYGSLEKTEKYILDNKVKILINNNGNEHKVLKNVIEEE